MTRKIITRAEITKAAEPAIAEAKSAKEIARCYPVMHELRTHLSTPDEFVERVQRQQKMAIALFTWRQEVKYALLPATGFRSRFSWGDFFMSTISSPAQKIDPLDSAVSFLIGWCDSLAPKNASISNSIPVCSASTPIAFIL